MDLAKELEELRNKLMDCEAEKIAIDQSYVDSLKNTITLRKETILQNRTIQLLSAQVSALKGEKDTLVQKIQDLESSLAVKDDENLTF